MQLAALPVCHEVRLVLSCGIEAPNTAPGPWNAFNQASYEIEGHRSATSPAAVRAAAAAGYQPVASTCGASHTAILAAPPGAAQRWVYATRKKTCTWPPGQRRDVPTDCTALGGSAAQGRGRCAARHALPSKLAVVLRPRGLRPKLRAATLRHELRRLLRGRRQRRAVPPVLQGPGRRGQTWLRWQGAYGAVNPTPPHRPRRR